MLALALALSPSSQHGRLQETLNWCQNFVVPYSLCPWAAASVTSDFFVVQVADDELEDPHRLVEEATLAFMEKARNDTFDSSVAITFVVFPSYFSRDFTLFHEWFLDIEDDWLETYYDDVTLAAFHPNWTYGGGDDPKVCVLDWEKRSPYPTVSIVAANAIDQAGIEATENIASNNAKVLQQKTSSEWKSIYSKAVRPTNEDGFTRSTW